MDFHLLNLAVTCVLVGLIWTIQVVHYPSFRYVPAADWRYYHHHHMRAISSLVMPLMLAEVLLAAIAFTQMETAVATGQAAILAAIWLVTFGVHVPQHSRLEKVHDQAIIGALVKTNWIRTGLWSAKALVILQTMSS